MDVLAQAVSKWENGGVLDTELRPMIADYFGVSVDSLFGRMVVDYVDLQMAVNKVGEAEKEWAYFKDDMSKRVINILNNMKFYAIIY